MCINVYMYKYKCVCVLECVRAHVATYVPTRTCLSYDYYSTVIRYVCYNTLQLSRYLIA